MTSIDKVANTYMFITDGSTMAITPQTLAMRANGDILDWTRIRTKPNNATTMACFVPKTQKGQIQTSWGTVRNLNGVGVSHGKGDFIVCSMLPNGKPNLSSRWVVNGEIFADTYVNQGWTDCLVNTSSTSTATINDLPKLVDRKPVESGVD